MGVITSLIRLYLAYRNMKRLAKRSRQHFMKELIRQGIDRGIANELAEEYESQIIAMWT